MLGTVCMLGNIDGKEFAYKSITQSSWNKNKDTQKLHSIWFYNISKLKEAVEFLLQQDKELHMFRISSSMFPLLTLDEFWDYFGDHSVYNLVKEKLLEIRRLTENTSFRFVAHPAQFTLLNSKNPKVLQSSIRDLQMHYWILNKISSKHSINIHLGSGGEDKIKRFEDGFSVLKKDYPWIANTLSIENDEKVASLEDVIEVYKRTGVAVCYDFHHDYCMRTRNGVPSTFRMPTESQMKDIEDSWASTGLKPAFHVSNSREEFTTGMKASPHSDYLYDFPKNAVIIDAYKDGRFDLEIEAKAKFPAVKKFYEFFQ